MKSIATAGLVIILFLVFLDVLKKQNRLIGGLHSEGDIQKIWRVSEVW